MFRSRKKSARLDAKRLGSRSRFRRSAFERLEDRRLLAAEIVWVGPNNGAWSQASHWNLGRVPAATDDVVIPSVAGDQNINFSSGTVSVNSITLAERLTLTGGSLQVTGSVAGGNVSGSGVVQLSSGTLRTAVLAATTQLVTAGGTLSGVTVNGAFTVNRGALTINSGLTLNGTMAVGSADGNINGNVSFSGTQTLAGTGTITFGGSASNTFGLTGSGTTVLTIGSGITIQGMAGAITEPTRGTNALVNQGTINIPEGGDFRISGNAWRNLGTINVNRGTIRLDGVFKSSDLGTFNASTGTVHVTGVMDNAGSTFTLQPSLGGDWWLSGGTILGGTIAAASGQSIVLTRDGGTLDGVTTTATIDGTRATDFLNRNSLTVKNGLTLNSSLRLGNTAGTINTGVTFNGTQTLGGTGTVTFGGSTLNSMIFAGSSSTQTITLTIGTQLTIEAGAGALRDDNQIFTGSEVIVNRGTIRVGVGGNFTLGGVGWRNEGVITVDRATMNLGGSFNATALGNFTATSSTVNLTGVMDNAGSTFTLQPTFGGDWWLRGGTIRGGTIAASSGQMLVVTNTESFLDGVTTNVIIDGSRVADTFQNRNLLSVQNGLTMNAAMRLGSTDGTVSAVTTFVGTQTLEGTGTVTFGGSMNNTMVTAGTTSGQTVLLTIGPQITIDAGTGALRDDGYNFTGIEGVINRGTIRVGAGGNFTIGSTNWRNEGTITVTGGTMNLGGSFAVASLGNFTATSSTVNLTGVMDNAGSTFTLQPTLGGDWWLRGGTIRGGTIAAASGQMLVVTNTESTLDGVTTNVVIDGSRVTDTFQKRNLLTVRNGLTMNAAMRLGSTDGTVSAVATFVGTQTLGGTGTVTLGGSTSNAMVAAGTASGQTMTLTIGPQITIDVGAGALRDDNASFTGTEWLVNRGVINVPAGRTFSMAWPNWWNEGTINAEGNLTIGKSGATTTNAGVLNLGVASTATITGDFVQGSAGTLKTRLAGTVAGQYGRGIISGAASLGGRFEVALQAGYSPAINNSFTVLSYGSKTGEFATLVGLNFAPPKLFQVGYAPLKFTLTAALDPNAAPDLVVVSPSVSPQSPKTGDQVTLQWQISNRGSAPTAASWTDRVEIVNRSTGVTIASGDVIYNASSRGALPNGQATTQSLTFQIPHALRGVGQLQARITTDHLDTIRENFEGAVGETNNRTDFDFTTTLANYPDLQVENLRFATSPLLTGQEATVRWSTANRGAAATSGTWKERVIVTQVAGGNSIAFRDVMHEGTTIGVNALSAERSFTFTLPDGDLASGQLRVMVTTDFDEQVIELNAADSAESNNVAYATATASIGPYPELSVGTIQLPAIVSLGTPFTINWTVLNSGNAPLTKSVSDRVYLSIDDTLDPGIDRLLATVNADPWLPVAASGTYTASASVTLPRDETVAAGDYKILVVTDALSNQFETNEGDNRLASPKVSVVADALSDLVVTEITTATEVIAGAPVAVTWKLKNQGIAPATGPWTDRLFYSTDATIGGDEVLDSFLFSGTLNPGESVSRTQTVRFPSSFAGAVRLVVRTDALGTVMELSNDNNAAIDDQPINVLVPPPPNLVVSSIDVPANGSSGQGVTVRWRVNNVGQGATGAIGWSDRVYLSRDGVIDAGDVVLGTIPNPGVGGLAAGANYLNDLTFNLPQAIEGSYRLIVVTDVGDRVAEGANENDNVTVSSPIEIALTPPPDLVVASVVVNPTDPFAGQHLVVGWTVTNQGLGAAAVSGWSDRVYVSFNDSTWDPTDAWIGTVPRFGQLGVGQSYNVSGFKVRLPAGISGPAHLIVRTDTNDELYEHQSETNNDRSLAIEVSGAPSPDLTVRSIAAPTQGYAGQPFTVAYTVANDGPGPTVASIWSDAIYLSPTPTLDLTTARLLGSRPRFGVLAAGQTERQSYTFQLENTLSSGSYFVIVATDAMNAIKEADDENNIVAAAGSTAITFAPPDLAISDVTAPSTSLSGQELTLRYTVTNRGVTPTPTGIWYDTVTLSNDGTARPTDPLLARVRRMGVLAPGQSETRSVTFRVPNDRIGSFTILVSADAGGSVYEADEGNNVGRGPLRIDDNRPDLIVADFRPRLGTLAGDGPVVPGSSLSFDNVIENRGPGGIVRGSWNDRLILSANNAVGDADDVLLASYAGAGAMQAGGTISRQGVNFSIPASIAAGTYRLFLVTDATNNIIESTEGNNASTGVPITIAAPASGVGIPDLRVTTVSAPQVANSGESIVVNWHVTNGGTSAAAGPWWSDAVWLSRDGVLDATDTFVGSYPRTMPLAPGESYTRDATVRLGIDLSGDHVVIVRTDHRNLIFEGTGEGNNTTASSPATSVTLTPTPDLRIEQVTSPANATAGGEVTIAWQVLNGGVGEARTSWHDAVYLSPTPTFDPPRSVLLGFVASNTTSLAAGGRYTRSENFTIPHHVAGDRYVVVMTDALRQAYERDGETNNVGTSAGVITIAARPIADLVVDQVTGGDRATIGRESPITFTVRNAGPGVAMGRWSDTVYLSSDDIWDAGDVLVGSVVHAGGLAVGSTYTATLNTPLPGVMAGDYKVLVRTDVRNVIAETSEANNVGSRGTPLTLEVPVLGIGSEASGRLQRREAAYYRVDVEAGQTLVIEFDSPSTSGFTELYASFGAIPRRGLAEFSAIETLRQRQRIVIPVTRAGSYYVMAQGTGLGSVPRDYRITARTVGFTVLDSDFGDIGATNRKWVVDRRPGEDLSSRNTLKIIGAKFTGLTTVELVREGLVIAATGLQLVDGSTLYATFDLPAFGVLEGFEAGRYDLRVVDPAGGSVLVPSSVNVIPNGRNQGRISVRFEASDRVRGDGVNPFAVWIANTSTANGYAPLVTLRSRQAGTRLGISPTATTFESYPFLGIASEGPAGVYAPGESGAFHFYLSAGGSESAVDMRVITSEDATPIDWGSLRDSLRPATIPVEAWGPIFENLTASITTWGEYVVLLNETAIALSLIGERVSDLQTLWAFHLRQAMNAVAPVPHLTSVVDGYLGLPGLPLGLDRTFGVTLADRYGVGLFGRGWVSSWDAQLERSADGMVRILGMGGAGRFFMPDAVTPGRFIGRFGETAELNLTDGFWRLREASGRITGFRFDGRIEWIEEAGGHRVTAGFAMGRLVTLTHSSGELLTITYGASGRPIELRDGAGRVTRYAYDASGERLLSVTTPGGVTTTYAYQLTGTAQLLGTLTSITIGTEVTLLTYDEEGRLAMSSRGGANVVRYRYAVGGRIDVIESTGTRVLFHDAFGRLVRTQDRFGRIEIVTPTSGGFGWHELGGGGLLFDRAGMIGGGEFVPAVATYAPKVIDARAEALSAIVGPEGVGDGRWVGGFAPLAYTIRFGNDATIVKAPVQVAEITQRLDASLDPSSLRLRSFGFGGEVFEVPEDRAEYATRLDLRARLGIFVDVFAAIDIVTGIIRWSFTAIDPVTGDVPTDRETGFLPADALAVGGGGFVSYSVRLRAGVVTGTRIDAIASVIIDGGVAIETPKVFNIVDVTAPDVAVTEITELGGRYRVKWRGSDGDGGSGIARYDLYVSENDGPYTLWLDDTTLLEAEFVGVAGRRYRFYCNGFDLAGNVGLGSASRDHDYGDAPLPYPVTIAENGARHRVGSLFLGDAIGVHVDGLPDTDAEGDEGDNGVRLITTLIGADAVTTSTFTVFTSGNGRLDAWIDLNRDGDWDDSGEQLLMSVGVTTGLNVLPFNILAASRFGRTAARFRLSIEGGLSATGEADSGEVEDYLFVVEDGRGQAKRDVRVDMPESGLFRLATIDQRVVVRGEGRDLFAAPVGSVGSVAIVGGPSDDVLELGDYAGNYSYDTGGGSDTLQLVTQGRVIDLTRSTPDVPRGLAAIDLRGTGSNRVVLDPTSVEAIGPVGRPLRLVHDADDVITLGSGWRVERPVFDGVTFVHVLVTVTVQIEIVNTKPFQNPLNALDVNRDAKVEPLDALISLNMISRILGGPVIPNPIAGSDLSGHLYPDVTGDGNATPLDALLVINWLGRRAASGEGEFDEALSVDATVSDTQPNIQAPTEPDTKPGFEAAAIGNTPFGAWRVAPQPVATGTQPVATGTSGADGNASSDEPFGIDPSVTSPPKRAIVVGGIADRSLWSCAAIDDYFAASVNDEAANSESSIDDHGIGESPLDGLK